MLLSRLNRTLSNGLLLKGGCGWSSAKQRLSLPIGRLFAENGKKNGSGSNERPPLKFQRWKDIWANMKASGSNRLLRLKDFVSRNAKTSIPLASAAGYFLYCCGRILYFEKRLSSTTNKKLSPIANEDYVDRTEEKARLRELIMSPFPPSSYFHVYIGPHRAGKSRAMMEVVDELRKEGVKGVHYVTAEQPLYKCLAKAFSMDQPAVMHGLLNAVPNLIREAFAKEQAPEISLSEVTHRLGESAREYANGRVTTIIIDGVNKLVPLPPSDLRGPEELRKLLDRAKDHADDGVIHWILVDSSGVALDVMRSVSSSSRLKLVFSRDVSEEEAKEFLKKRFEAAGKKFDADDVYKCVTGGRIGLLKNAADAVKEKPKSTSKEGGGLKAALKRLFGIAAPPKPARESVAKAITTKEELFKSVLSVPNDDLAKVFSVWPRIEKSEPAQEFQYRILRLLAENPKGFEKATELRDRAGQDDFKAKGVDCDAAIRQLLKRDLLRYVNLGELELHSNAIKYIVLNEGHPLKSGGDDEKK
ncbi:uncharacterized protein [Oscarella lobularis]|uniref:uncharacterized protein n=1 Tax=Oscarella lobularis TaxID=121494 RepID=UPI003314161D